MARKQDVKCPKTGVVECDKIEPTLQGLFRPCAERAVLGKGNISFVERIRSTCDKLRATGRLKLRGRDPQSDDRRMLHLQDSKPQRATSRAETT